MRALLLLVLNSTFTLSLYAAEPSKEDAGQKKPDARPNIIVILTDDHRADYLGCAGHPIIKTPHLDQLAQEGTYFHNSFVTSASCTPSRTCLLTGQYERKHGVTFGSNSSLTEEAFSETYPALLRKAGYYTGYVGKNHTPIGPLNKPSKTITLGPMSKVKDGSKLAYLSGHMENQFDYFYGNHGHMSFYPKSIHPEYKNAQANTQIEIVQEGALNFLKANPSFQGSQDFLASKPADKPFCLLVNFNVPHSFGTKGMQQRPGDPELYKSQYREHTESLTLPETYISLADITTPKLPPHVYNGKYLYTYQYVKKPDTLREQMIRTLQTVTGVDHLVGALVEELKAQGLDQNTVIVFTSDHGLQFGEHGLGGKCLLYEESLRVPLIIRDPRNKSTAGQRPEQLALTIDIAPTLLTLAGLQPHPEMQGTSLTPLMKGQNPKTWRTEAFSENMFMGQNYPRVEAVRSHQFKYLRYFDKKNDKPHLRALTLSINGEQPIYEELYDLKNDPQERHNLAQKTKHATTLNQLRQRCQQLVTEAKGSSDYPKTYIATRNPVKPVIQSNTEKQ